MTRVDRAYNIARQAEAVRNGFCRRCCMRPVAVVDGVKRGRCADCLAYARVDQRAREAARRRAKTAAKAAAQ